MQVPFKLQELEEWRDRILDFSNGLMESLESLAAPRITMIHATFDDVGKRHEDGMCAVVGWVAYREQWNTFNWQWMKVLEQHGLGYLHTAEFLNKFPVIGDAPLSDDEVYRILQPFTDVIHGNITVSGNRGFGVCVITECAAYDALDADEKRVIKKPELHSFEMAVGLAFRYIRDELHGNNLMALQFDESEDAARLYSCYKQLKEKNPTLRNFMSGICFVDDKKHPPMQAADLLGNLTLKGWRRWKRDGELPAALRNLVYPKASGQTLTCIVYNLERLKTLAKMRIERKTTVDSEEG